MKIGKEILLLSVVSVVFLAGCARGPSAPSSTGVSITSFAPELAEVESNSPLSISATVKNSGSQQADNVIAELIGLPIGSGDSDWKLSASTTNPTQAKTLFAADPDRGFPEGQEDVFIWDLTTPKKDVSQTFSFNTRVYYTYKTFSENTVRLVSLTYFRSLSSSEQTNLQKGVVSSSTTSGPLAVSVKTPQPLITGTGDIPVQITIENIGNGRVFGTQFTKPTETTLDRFTIKVEGATCAAAEFTERLLQGESRVVSCKLPVTFVVDTFRDVNIKVTLTYRYFEEAQSSVKVLKSLGITTGTVTPTPTPITGVVCGNGRCETGETTASCPADCPKGVTPPTGVSASIVTSQGELPWYKDSFFVKLTFNDPNGNLGQASRKCQYSTTGKSDFVTLSCSGTTDSRDVQITVGEAAGNDCRTEGQQACIVRAKIVDASNNLVSTSIAEKPFNIDRTKPQFQTVDGSIIRANPTVIRVGQAVSYSATVTDGGGSQLSKCVLSVDGAPQTQAGSMTISGSTALQSYTRQTAGSFTVKIECEDLAKNSEFKEQQFSTEVVVPLRSNPSPTGTVSGATQTLSLKTDEQATCRYSTTAGTAYDSMPTTQQFTAAADSGATTYTHTKSVSDLTAGSKTFYVRCIDTSGNKNADDFSITFTVS